MNPKKKSRRYRASVSIQALDLVISRFTNSLEYEYLINMRESPESESGTLIPRGPFHPLL
jgi:hypothetical protein